MARSLILRAHHRLRVPADDGLDPALAGYDEALERGLGFAFIGTIGGILVRTCTEFELWNVPFLEGNGNGMRILLGVYRGERLFGPGWKEDVEGMPDDAVFCSYVQAPGLLREYEVSVSGWRRVILRTGGGGEPYPPEVFVQADEDEHEHPLIAISRRRPSVFELPAAAYVDIDCDEPDLVAGLLRLTDDASAQTAGPLELTINGVPYTATQVDRTLTIRPAAATHEAPRTGASGVLFRRRDAGRPARRTAG